jgi:uncharacterized protein YeaO (DUF488 family)
VTNQETRVQVVRVYDRSEPSHSTRRILVDRLWPRGIGKAAARLDAWFKDVAPSPELRRWYAHDRTLFQEFSRRYRGELEQPARAALVHELTTIAGEYTLTLLTATRDVEVSAATVLARCIAEQLPPASG